MSKGPTGRGASGNFGEMDFRTDEVTGLNAYTYSDRVKSRLNDIGLGNVERPTLVKEHKGIFPGLEPGDYFNGRLPVVIHESAHRTRSKVHQRGWELRLG